MQALLDGSLPDGEVAGVQKHLASCARCASELEAWQVLFHELGELGGMSPSDGFADRVLREVPLGAPEPAPLPARIRGWIGGRSDAVEPARHLDPGALQELLDGRVSAHGVTAMESHLRGCRLCREEMGAWRALVVCLDDLPRLAPSLGFSERVMAHIRVQAALAVARPSFRERVLAWVEAVNPRTSRRVAALAGAAVTPLVTLALVTYTVFSHPLVTVGSLWTFLSLRSQDLLAAVMGPLGEGLVSLQAHSAFQYLAQTPAAMAGVLSLLGCLTLMAVWVLYRHLFATNPVESRYAHFPR
jgi:anti-sigma factor RsiW